MLVMFEEQQEDGQCCWSNGRQVVRLVVNEIGMYPGIKLYKAHKPW